MVDLLFIAILVAFFALMVAFVRVCERIVGRDDVVGTDVDLDVAEANDATITEEVPA